MAFKHEYPFDPRYGYSLAELETLIPLQPAPADFRPFWEDKYQQALALPSHLYLQQQTQDHARWQVFDCYYDSADGLRIGAWLLLPKKQSVEQLVVWAHGYGGLNQPDLSWALANTAILLPCIRGFGRSEHSPISSDPYWHVLHNIQDKHQYILGGCVQDLWCGISAVTNLYPQLRQRVSVVGSSFGGGLSVLAAAFDPRVQALLTHVPTFGDLQRRLSLPTMGSGAAVQSFNQHSPELISATLPYFDAAHAAKLLNIPSHWSIAEFDPFVAPPGQFSLFNAARGDKQCLVLSAGHFQYRGQVSQLRQMRREQQAFIQQRGKA